MNIPFLIAACVAIFIGIGHAYIGEAFFFKGISDASYPSTFIGDGNLTKRLMKGAWHLLSVALLTSGVVFLLLALTNIFTTPKEIANVLFWQYVGFTLIILVFCLGRPILFIRVPLWLALGGIAVMTLLGSWSI